MKTNTSIAKSLRRAHEQLGVVTLLLATLVSIASISHDTRKALKEIALRPAITIINNSGRENETARMPVSYEGVFRLQGNSGQ